MKIPTPQTSNPLSQAELATVNTSATTAGRTEVSFDADWRFLQADAPGAQNPLFDDAGWRRLNVPHDWSIAGPFDQNNPSRGAGAFLPAGIGWYRKSFTLPPASQNRCVFIDFEGVMTNSEVYVNGFLRGKRPNGSVSFRYELTDHLVFGAQSNILAVRVDNSLQPASRWASGAGITRHVRLVQTESVHLEHWGTFISTPDVSAHRAMVRVQSAVVNQSAAPHAVTLQVNLFDLSGRGVAGRETPSQLVPAGQTVAFEIELRVENPHL